MRMRNLPLRERERDKQGLGRPYVDMNARLIVVGLRETDNNQEAVRDCRMYRMYR
jgi:hypothetical protein